MRKTGPLETDWIVHYQFRAGNGTNQFVYFHALKTSHDTKSSHSLGNRRAFTRDKIQDATD